MSIQTNLEEIYKIIKEIEKDNSISQRALAKRLGYSLGKINYLIKALVEKGIIKLERFKKKSKQMGISLSLNI